MTGNPAASSGTTNVAALVMGVSGAGTFLVYLFGGLVPRTVSDYTHGSVTIGFGVAFAISTVYFVVSLTRGSEYILPDVTGPAPMRKILVEQVPGLWRGGHAHVTLWWEDPVRVIIDPVIRTRTQRYFAYALWIAHVRAGLSERYGMTLKAGVLRALFDSSEVYGASWLIYYLTRHRMKREVEFAS